MNRRIGDPAFIGQDLPDLGAKIVEAVAGR